MTQSQEEIIAEQKKNCPFCKIASGEIPATKIFENDTIMAIMDINPAAPGHLLIMPKEHYPILPLIPPEVFHEMFKQAKFLSRAQRQSLLSQHNTWLIANGGAAGQRSSHFILHIIGQDKQFDQLMTTTPTTLDQQQIQQLSQLLSQNIPQMLKKTANQDLKPLNTTQTNQDINPSKTPDEKLQQTTTQNKDTQHTPNHQQNHQVTKQQKQQLAALLEQDESLRTLLINNPDEFSKSEQVQELIKGIDVHALSKKLKETYGDHQ